MQYEELYAKYQALVQENVLLKAQVESLQKQLSAYETPAVSNWPVGQKGINMQSTSKDKVNLFMSLFQGRTDVFARRWQSKNNGNSGYQPVCGNEWAYDLCDKRKYKCGGCPNRKLLPLTEQDVYNHLAGKDELCRDVIGVYPMLQDETCMFLCIDFDEADYPKDAKAFVEACHAHSVPAYIERSRSGNGAHIWIFFDKPISAAIARKLGTGLLTYVMNERSEIPFKSYDRLFPNHDIMPEGGFGNLVALPLQGQARKNGNSIFVDGDFVPFPDQWNYLASFKRLPTARVDELIATVCKDSELGTLVSSSDEKPWETPKKPTLSAMDFLDSISITYANMLYIPKTGLSAAAKNTIKRLAAFKNPEFYRSQAMRLPVYNKPRIIYTADETDDYIALPRGCEEALCTLLNTYHISYDIEDKTNTGIPIDVAFNGILRDEQIPAAETLLTYKNGILSATTAFGKTVIAANIIASRKVNTLVLVHTQALLLQWQKSLEQFLTLNISEPVNSKKRGQKKKWSPVGLLGGGNDTLHGTVDVAVMQSLFDGDDVKALVRNYGMIIVDECHHVSAVNFEKILKYANAAYVYGLTATPTRQDGHHPIIYMQCGPIRYRIDAKAQAEKRAFEHFVIPRFTSFRCTANKSITELYSELASSTIRNCMIVNDIVTALQIGRNPIVLTERKEHAVLLGDMLQKHCENVIVLTGASTAKEKRKTDERLSEISAEQQLVIIATGKYVGEGFDYPPLDTLFLALPIAWKGKVTQYAGRLHRNYSGKTEVQIYDYADIHVPVLERMYQKRVKSYAAIGYQTKTEIPDNIKGSLIYDGKSFYPIYCNDIETAEHEILIISPFMRKNRVTLLTKVLSKALINSISVTIVTRPPEDFTDKNSETVIQITETLNSYGIKVVYKSNFHQKFTVIDQKIVWYGSVNFLSFGTAEESIMRLTSSDIAGELTDTVL